MWYRPYVLKAICGTGHMCYRPYVLQAICATGHMCYSPYVLQAIFVTGHMCYRPYVVQAICATGHMCYRPYMHILLTIYNTAYRFQLFKQLKRISESRSYLRKRKQLPENRIVFNCVCLCLCLCSTGLC